VLSGRLGNQIFQLCSALNLKAKYSTGVNLDARYSAPRDIQQLLSLKIVHDEEINLTNMQALYLENNILGRIYDFVLRSSRLVRYRLFRLTGLTKFNSTTHKSAHFMKDDEWQILTRFSGEVVGYFQDKNLVEKVWVDLESRVKRSTWFEIPAKLLSDQDVLIHVRLGDYLLHPEIGTLSESYYLEALKYFDYKNIYLITDDLREFRNRFPILKSRVIYIESSHEPLVAFKILCHSKNIIIGNSTFSYWGAIFSIMLNQYTKVVAPSPWRADNKSPSPLIDRFILVDSRL